MFVGYIPIWYHIWALTKSYRSICQGNLYLYKATMKEHLCTLSVSVKLWHVDSNYFWQFYVYCQSINCYHQIQHMWIVFTENKMSTKGSLNLNWLHHESLSSSNCFIINSWCHDKTCLIFHSNINYVCRYSFLQHPIAWHELAKLRWF